ncbi:MAG: hypothetical protein K2Z81_08250 [Cyanobacteria bacterium]|nr:hypothetical protein [Cyanobacteriota bacterium]
MDFSKMRGTGGEDSADLPQRSPGSSGPSGSMGPKNITETKAFQQGMGGIRNLWGNYLDVLGAHFERMSRPQQELFILRMCQVITIGCAIVLASFFYGFIPVLVRVFAFPVFIAGSWFAATRVVSPIIIAQFEHKLNRP